MSIIFLAKNELTVSKGKLYHLRIPEELIVGNKNSNVFLVRTPRVSVLKEVPNLTNNSLCRANDTMGKSESSVSFCFR